MLTTTIKAQDTKVKFAMLGGVNFQNWNGKDAQGGMLENKLITGFHAGINVQIPVAPEFYFQPGLLFSTKGTKMKTDTMNSLYKLAYLELPLNFVYKGVLGNGYVLVGFGPYLGYAIKGTVTKERNSNETKSDIEFKNSIETNDPKEVSYVRSFDAGANVFAGYEWMNGIFLQLNTQLGALKINPENKTINNDRTSIKNTGYGLSLGYRF